MVGGFRSNSDSFDSLLVGYYDDAELRYAGSVRGQITPASRAAVFNELSVSSLQPRACPFVDLPHRMPHRSRHPWDARIGSAHMLALRWVPPAVVIELAFLEWDRHRLLRDARFLGIREDKEPHAVGLD